MITSAPDYLPLGLVSFLSHFFNIFTTKSYDIKIENKYHNTILGYSCRSLFHTLMSYMNSLNEDLVIATTPLHHTSFRNIIELFVKPKNIHIIKMNKEYNKIESLPEVERCDLVIVTHLFGQDMEMNNFNEFKDKHNCLFIEDRVQGGHISSYNRDIFDISFYSCGMDKRPVALGGGFVNVRKGDERLNNITNFINDTTNSYTLESRCERFMFLLKKIPTYLLYNCKPFIYLFIQILNFFNINLLEFAAYYRKQNPGFAHDRYLKKPSNGLLKSICQEFNNARPIENLYAEKFTKFKSKLNERHFKKYIKWDKNSYLLTPYNTFYVDKIRFNEFKSYMKSCNICMVTNPTYKTFNHDYEGKEVDEEFDNSLVYMPSLANMSDDEMSYLAHKINLFEEMVD
jgi:hypothetical protein